MSKTAVNSKYDATKIVEEQQDLLLTLAELAAASTESCEVPAITITAILDAKGLPPLASEAAC